MRAAHMPKKDKLYASKYEFPNKFIKASLKGKGDGNYSPGWVQAKYKLEEKYREKGKPVNLIPVGSKGSQWAFKIQTK